MVPKNRRIFKIEAKRGNYIKRKVVSAIGAPLGYLLGLGALNTIYSDAVDCGEPNVNFMHNILQAMQVSYRVPEEDLARIPKEGPVAVVANHPFGGIEGIILGALLGTIRPDFKIMSNYLLHQIPELREMMIFVNPFGNKQALKSNIQPLKESLRWLRDGHMLGVFPAGEVSSMNWRKRHVSDPVWSTTVARIIQRVEAPVLPIYFQGSNGPMFQLLGLVHPRLRTAMLAREIANKNQNTFDITVGSAIPFSKISKNRNEKEMMAYLRLRTYMLDKRNVPTQRKRRFPLIPVRKKRRVLEAVKHETPVAPAIPLEGILKELEALPEACLLLETASEQVYVSKADGIPNILQEIGRLRELTFRQVGEGTGKPLDLDKYDDYYRHLFIWNKNNQDIVGAYRIGRTDEIIRKYEIEGLYTSSLFYFKPSLFKKMGPALEMGRSFVQPQYQKSFTALLLLWKGIGRYVCMHPDHKVLFGPVSISDEYSTVSRELIVRYLKQQDQISKLAKMVKPKTPLKMKALKRHEIREFRNILSTIEDVTEVIGDIESETKGIPVLLKQYLKLGGKVLSFNVDPDFNYCLDGLIVVDLSKTDIRILGTYMGRENAVNFVEYHAIKEGKSPALIKE